MQNVKKENPGINYLILNKNLSIKEILEKIEHHNLDVMFISDDNDSIIGITTDGDIVRSLLNGKKLDDSVLECLNTDFIHAYIDVPTEQILKQFDNKIRYIPILDLNNKFVKIITKNSSLNIEEEEVYVRAVSPVRISFGGGGSDLTHYFLNSNGAVINTTIDMFCHVTLKVRNDIKIKIYSYDLDEQIEKDNLEEILKSHGKFGLIVSILKLINPIFGFELYINSDFSIGSGLGGSAAVSSAVLGCFNQLRKDKWDKYELAEIAFQAERFILGISGGWQDQYATVFGGINFIEFSKEQNIIHPLRIDSKTILELEESLILCNTGINHESGKIHDNQKEVMKDSDIKNKVKQNVKLTYEMKNNLLKGKLTDLGRNLNQAWELKKQFSNQITTNEIDKIYDFAMQNGAIGGKLLGAGGGGYFLFFVPPFNKLQLLSALKKQGYKGKSFKFTEQGLTSWTVRINK